MSSIAKMVAAVSGTRFCFGLMGLFGGWASSFFVLLAAVAVKIAFRLDYDADSVKPFVTVWVVLWGLYGASLKDIEKYV